MSTGQIGKNTFYLYIRSFATLIISLYTSRVILDKLGIDDFGLYNTVGSITGMLTFLTTSLSLATSRYITYDLGSGDKARLQNTFGTILSIYLILTALIVISLELIGPWLISNKIVYEPSRAFAVNAVFHISVITVVVSMLSGPFSSLIIAHEDMNFFAFIGIFDAVAKLGICYLISTTPFDRLIVYAVLIFAVQLVELILNTGFVKKRYKDFKIRASLQKETAKSIGDFTGWSLIGSFSVVLQTYGVNIITNMFFGPAVVAARALSMQVSNAANTFIQSFMTAVKPQIVKRHAAGDEDSSNRLVQKSTIVSFILAALLCFPIILNTEYILNLWLKEVPEYAVVFVQLILVQTMFSPIENGLYSIFYTKGRIKENALVSPVIAIIMFVVVYILFKLGCSPVSLSYCFLISILLTCLIVKPILLKRLFNYDRDFFMQINIPCFKLLLLLTPVFILHLIFVKEVTFVVFVIETVLTLIYSSAVSYFFVLDKDLRSTIADFIKKK